MDLVPYSQLRHLTDKNKKLLRKTFNKCDNIALSYIYAIEAIVDGMEYEEAIDGPLALLNKSWWKWCRKYHKVNRLLSHHLRKYTRAAYKESLK